LVEDSFEISMVSDMLGSSSLNSALKANKKSRAYPSSDSICRLTS